MTLEELDKSLPEGLHDAQIRSYRRDFESATLTLFAKIVVGLSHEKKNQLLYRDGEIIFHGVNASRPSFQELPRRFAMRDVCGLGSVEQRPE
jgi:hypothetical protein